MKFTGFVFCVLRVLREFFFSKCFVFFCLSGDVYLQYVLHLFFALILFRNVLSRFLCVAGSGKEWRRGGGGSGGEKKYKYINL